MEKGPLNLTAKPLSPETWPDFEALFEKHRGVQGGCWCVYYLCKSMEFNRLGPEGRHGLHKELALGGRAGIVGFDEIEPRQLHAPVRHGQHQ